VGTTNTQTGDTFGETELNMIGTTGANGTVRSLINQMCSLGFYSTGDCQCANGVDNSGAGSPHTAPDSTPFTGNFRSPGLLNSVQVNTNPATGQIQIDIGPFKPADGALGAFLHGLLQWLPNKISGGNNTCRCSH
jgi:hypothetical protein